MSMDPASLVARPFRHLIEHWTASEPVAERARRAGAPSKARRAGHGGGGRGPEGPLDQARDALRKQLGPAATRRRDGRREVLPKAAGAVLPPIDARVKDVLAWAPFCLYGEPVLEF